MKKIALVMVFMLLAGLVFAGDVSEIDGYFWIKLSDTQKTSVIFGYLVAMATVWDFNNDAYDVALAKDRTEKNMTSMEIFSMSQEWASYPMSVSNIVTVVDAYYTDTSYLKYPLYLVIPLVCEKGWW